MNATAWSRGLEVAGGGTGVVSHAGLVLLRQLADRTGLTAGLSAALPTPGAGLDRGRVFADLACAIADGARVISDFRVMGDQQEVFGQVASVPTAWRALKEAASGGDRARRKVTAAVSKARRYAWAQVIARHGELPPVRIADRQLTGITCIRLDATVVPAHSSATWKKGYGFHPLGAWCRNTRECLAMLLRPGNAGSNTFTDHKEVLAAALRQVPARFRRKIMVRVDGAGASHDLIGHLLSLASPRRNVLFTCGWMITEADEDAIRLLPAGAWKPGIAQDGSTEEDKAVAEITHLMTRAENWPAGLRWIVRRVKPSRRQARNLTTYEKETGWRYNIICTNIPDAGIGGVPGSHHPQYIDVLHREHACAETAGVRTAKAMGLRALPSKAWQVNTGWVIAANIAADLAAWSRLLGLGDDEELRDANPDTLRYRIWHIPARLARHARQRTLAISPDWPWTQAFLTCWHRLSALPAPA